MDSYSEINDIDDILCLSFDKSMRLLEAVVILHNGKQELSLTFMLNEWDSPKKITEELSYHGIVIDEAAQFHLYFKKLLLTTTHRNSCASFSWLDYDGLTDDTTHPHQFEAPDIITKDHFNLPITQLFKGKHLSDMNCKYSLEFHLDGNGWMSKLENAVKKNSLVGFYHSINELNLSFVQFEDLFVTNCADFMNYMQQMQNQKIQIPSISNLTIYNTNINKYTGYILIECIKDIIKKDKCEYLKALFDKTDIFDNMNECVNIISYYFILSLTHQSKKCIKYLIGFWLNNVSRTFDNQQVFQNYMQLFINKSNMQNQKLYEFIKWISSTIEPSMLSESSFTFTLKQYHVLGRMQRYKCTKQLLGDHLYGSRDLIRVILELDGYSKEWFVDGSIKIKYNEYCDCMQSRRLRPVWLSAT